MATSYKCPLLKEIFIANHTLKTRYIPNFLSLYLQRIMFIWGNIFIRWHVNVEKCLKRTCIQQSPNLNGKVSCSQQKCNCNSLAKTENGKSALDRLIKAEFLSRPL